VLIVLQGVDTAGKDGTIRQVATALNPAGCTVAAFKEPTAEELSHDFLWRIHRQAPASGMIAFFNRSHYEDVLVARVHKLVPAEEWKQRYKEINDFERMLARNGTLVLKFFLHLSKDEQRKRLLAREQEPDKAWKIAAADWQERRYWDNYEAAYEDALGKCSAEWAPWYIVPANHKWYRNYVVARTVVERLSKHEASWKAGLLERGKRELAALKEAHISERE
jgi:PPK2 family polyphosphate:nucleotide phosphotransferase